MTPPSVSRFLLRLPSDIKTRLESEADIAGMSLNALIVAKLSEDDGGVSGPVGVVPAAPAPANRGASLTIPRETPRVDATARGRCMCGHPHATHNPNATGPNEGTCQDCRGCARYRSRS